MLSMKNLISGLFARRFRPVVLGLVVVGYLWFIGTHCSPYASGADSSGYLNEARLLLDGQISRPVPAIAGLPESEWDPMLQQPLGFIPRVGLGGFIPTYPIGLPLHLALASKLVGLDHAMVLVSLLCVVASGFFTVALGRRLGLPLAWAVVGGGFLLLSPLFLLMVNQPMSDVPALAWVCAACYFSVRARDHGGWALLAGFSVAVAVLVRPTNLLVMLPVAVALGFRWRAWLALVVAGAPGAAFLAWYNVQLYGKVLTTGYGDIGGLLKLEYVPHNTLHFMLWLAVLLSPPLAVAAYGLPWLRRQAPVTFYFLTAWLAVFLGFYVWYFHSGETWWYLRFILPAFPAVIFAGLLVLHRMAGAWMETPRGRTTALAVLAVCGLWLVWWDAHFNVHRVKRGELNYPQAIAWLNEHVPADAIVMEMQLSGASAYYASHTMVRWDMMDAANWARLRAAARAAGRPIYAALMEFELKEAFPDRIPGRWEKVGQTRRVTFLRLVDEAEPEKLPPQS